MPLDWDELGTIPASSHFTMADLDSLRERARRLSDWGQEDQALPDV